MGVFALKLHICIAAVITAFLVLGATTPATAQPNLIHKYVSAALRGDLSSAPGLFDQAEELSASEDQLRERFEARFVTQTETRSDATDDPFTNELIDIYHNYWVAVLMQQMGVADGKASLQRELTALLLEHDTDIPADADFDALEQTIHDHLQTLDIGHLGGRTRPHMELMLWQNEETSTFDVELTDTSQSVTVVFIGGFLVRGWSEFATFGRASSGGWATEEMLFAVDDRYDRSSERFLISYLKHEGRHFADYPLFPNLDQIELEYRAKLTELSFLDEAMWDVLAHFIGAAEPEPQAPHSYANYAVVRDLSSQLFGDTTTVTDLDLWKEKGIEAIHSAARQLLERNTEALAAEGPATQGVIYGETSD